MNALVPHIQATSLPKLPDDWAWVRFADFCERVSVGHVGPTTKHFVEAGQGIPLIRSQNVRPGRLVLQDIIEISNDFHAKLKKSQLRSGDVLIVRVGANRSDCCVVPEGIGPINCANIVFARPNETGTFFSYYFNTNFGRKMLLGTTTGAAQEVINTRSVADTPVPLPPLKTRQRIAGILSAYDDLIENNRRRIALLEQAARLLYREWFVHFRFPGYETAKLVDGLPEAWATTTLGEKAQILKGRNITKETVNPGSVPVVAGGLKPAYFHDTANVKGPVVTISASGANAGHVAIYFEDIWASDCSYLSVTTNPNLFFIHQLLLDNVARIRAMQKGAAQPHVYPKDLQRMEVTFPAGEIIDQFVQLLEPIYSQIQALEKKNAQLTKARDLLLPRLMDGRIPVKV